MAKQVKEPRTSKCQLITSWIGSHDPLRKEAEFKGGQERENILNELELLGMLDVVERRQANQANRVYDGRPTVAKTTRSYRTMIQGRGKSRSDPVESKQE